MIKWLGEKKDFCVWADEYPKHSTLLKYYGNDEKVFVPKGINAIAEFAFYNNIYIKKIFLPESVEMFFKSAVQGCENLESILYKRDSKVKRLK